MRLTFPHSRLDRERSLAVTYLDWNRSDQSVEFESSRSQSPERRYHLCSLPWQIPWRKSVRHFHGKGSEKCKPLQPGPGLQAVASCPRKSPGHTGLRRSVDRHEGERRERGDDSTRESLRKNGKASHGRQDSTVQVEDHKHQETVDRSLPANL